MESLWRKSWGASYAGVAVLPGCEREDLERQCQEWLKGLPQRIEVPDRAAEILKALTQCTINSCLGEAQTDADACSAAVSDAKVASSVCTAGDGVTSKSESDEKRVVPVHAAAAKEKGNAAFSAGDFRKAMVHYTMALRVTGPSSDEASCDEISAFRAALFSNRSAAHASVAMWQQALHDAQEALKIDDQCAKYWCRKGAAQLGHGRLQDAICSYKQALEVGGNNSAAQAGLELARSKLADAQ